MINLHLIEQQSFYTNSPSQPFSNFAFHEINCIYFIISGQRVENAEYFLKGHVQNMVL